MFNAIFTRSVVLRRSTNRIRRLLRIAVLRAAHRYERWPASGDARKS